MSFDEESDMSKFSIRFIKPGRFLLVTGILLVTGLVVTIVSPRVSWAATPGIRIIKTGSHSPFGSPLSSVAVDRTTNMVYVANGKSVSVIDGGTEKVMGTIHVDSLTTGIAVDPVTDMVYVANGKSVSVIDGGTEKVMGTIHVDSITTGIAVDPVTDMVYVAKYNAYTAYFGLANVNTISVIDGGTEKVMGSIHENTNGFEFVVDPVTDMVCVANGKSVSVIDGGTEKVMGTIHVDSLTTGIAVDPATDTVYATNGKSVTVISRTDASLNDMPVVSIWFAAAGLVVVGGGGGAFLILSRRRHTMKST